MALIDKLTAIADGFRASRGTTETYTLDRMAELAAEKVSTETILKPTEYPDYVRKETNRVADEVRTVLKDESIVSICLSDSHYPADNYTKSSAIHAMMAIKGLTYLIPVDFIAHLGDIGFEGSGTTTIEPLRTNLIEMLSYITESNGDSIPLFVAIGNHDCGNYITTEDATDQIPGNWLYDNFTTLSASDDTVFSGEDVGGYCYRDFTDKKIRVFLLNTSEGLITGGHSTDTGTSVTQQAWIASKLQELNTKSDASDWGFIVLCHYPADYGAARPLSNLFAAYVNGTSITLNGTTYNFSGKNSARFIVQHHGHIHNFLSDRLYYGNTPTQYDAWRVAIPNTQNNRENYYGEFNGIQYSEDVTQTKEPGTVQDTSFVVNVINPSEETIYSFYYGKGYNRVISYAGIVRYSITNSLTDVATSNSVTILEENQGYTATLTPTVDGYTISTIKITMGGKDVTDDVYIDGVIDIESVTGNVIITAKATKVPTSNLHLITESANSTEPWNGVGYKNGVYLSTSGNSTVTDTSVDTAIVTTGFIPYTAPATGRPQTIIIQGAEWQNISHCRLYFIGEDKASINSPWITGVATNGSALEYNYTIKSLGDKHFKLIPKWNATQTDWVASGGAGAGNSKYIRLSLVGTGEDLIITFEDADLEDITPDNYTITYNLTNVTSSDASTSVTAGGSYTTDLIVNSGYTMSSVKITMGGTDITSSALTDDFVAINPVTGNIVITATASGCTNQIPISLASAGGTAVYNGIGYKTGTRVNSSFTEVSAANMCVTGYIPCKSGDTIRIKNVTISGGSTAYGLLYTTTGGIAGSYQPTQLTSATVNGIITLTVPNGSTAYFRLSVGVIDDTSIITVNEEITD